MTQHINSTPVIKKILRLSVHRVGHSTLNLGFPPTSSSFTLKNIVSRLATFCISLEGSLVVCIVSLNNRYALFMSPTAKFKA